MLKTYLTAFICYSYSTKNFSTKSFGKQQDKHIKSKGTIKTKGKQRTKARTIASEKFAETASSSRNIQKPDSEETADDNEDVECKGCRMTWSEDQELWLSRTWVNCDIWMHYDCSSREVDSDERFCCPD